MNIEKTLCEAFCDGITVSRVPAGFAVSTAFEDASGDRIGFYVTRDAAADRYRIEDDGSLVPTLIASGVNILTGTRQQLFGALLKQGNAEYDQKAGELRTLPLAEHDVPLAAMRFVAMMMRIAGLAIAHPQTVTATFRDDAIEHIKTDLSGVFRVETEHTAVSPMLAEFEPDVLLSADGKRPVAVFIAMSDQRLYEAILMQMAARYEAQIECAVVALIDREGSKLTSRRMRQRARNRLDAASDFYGEETAAVARIAREATPTTVH